MSMEVPAPFFGPREQTPAQRQALLDRAAAINATQGRYHTPFADELGKRYVAGELSLAECNAQLRQHYGWA